MGLKNEIKVGDYVICIAEPDMPRFIGSKWCVIEIVGTLYYCVNSDSPVLGTPQVGNESSGLFIFKKKEIAPVTPLMEELL